MAVNGEKIPITFQLGDKLIDGAVVKPLTFSSWLDCVTEAQNLREPKTAEGKIRRLRMVRQVTYFANGAAVPVQMTDVLKLPIPSARLITAQLDHGDGKEGKVVQEGDGIEKAIVYKLGTPIPVQGKPPIEELEFSAKTYGDIEDVMSASGAAFQTSLLISTLAKPLGTSLMTLPSWAMEQITIADGLAIMSSVLPHFLGLPPES